LQRALAISPEESGSLLQLGMVIRAKVDLERASKYFSMARQLNFKAVEAYYLDGYIQWKQGDTRIRRQRCFARQSNTATAKSQRIVFSVKGTQNGRIEMPRPRR
jgi:hypothetical protein